MRGLAAYIMRGQLQAITTVVGFAVLALPLMILMPLSWSLSFLSVAGVGLVTLVQGPAEGGRTVLGSSLLMALLTTLIAKTPAPAIFFAIILWLPAWSLGSLLYRTRSLSMVLQVVILLGVAFVSGIYLVLGDPADWWYQHLMTNVLPAMEQAGLTLQKEPGFEAELKLMTTVMAGLMAIIVCWSILAGLLIARWWQSQLYKPGAFGEEFRALRFGKIIGLAVATLILMNTMGSGVAAELALNMLLVIFSIMVLQGLAIVHTVVLGFKINVAWLVMLYVLLIFAVPYMLLLMVFVGLVDNWLDLRNRFQPNS